MKKLNTKLIVSIFIGIIIIGGLTGCGNNTDTNKDGSTKYEDSDSPVDSVKIPANFPKSIPVYKTGTYTSASVYENNTGGYIMITKKDPSEIKEWFRGKLTDAGWKIEIESVRQYEFDSIWRFDFSNNSDNKIGTVFMDEYGDDSYQISVNVIKGSSEDIIGN